MNRILLISALMVSNLGWSQTIIPLGADLGLCPNDQVGIVAGNVDTSNLIIMDNPIYVSLTDDVFSDTISIGFDFTFYDTVYNQVCIGSNGMVTFDTTHALGYCPWSIVVPIPSIDGYQNIVMPSFMDINPSAGGSVSYQTIGIAPNREFVVYYNSPPIFSCGVACWSIVMVLYETSNEIDVFLKDKPICPGWNNGSAIQGIENQDGTIAHGLQGRNYPIQWSATADGKKWTPNGLASYVIDTIPFSIVIDTVYNISWGNTLADTLLPQDTLFVTAQSSGVVGYFMGISSPSICDGLTVGLSDTSWIDMDFQIPTFDVLDDFCASGSGSISSTFPSADSSVYWPSLNLSTDTLTNLSPNTFPYEFTSVNGCLHNDTLYIVNLDTFSVQTVQPLCSTGSNGSITISPDLPTSTYNWINPPAATGNSALLLNAGLYECYVSSSIGCSDTISVNLTSLGGATINNILIQSETCFQYGDGQFDFNIVGNAPPFTILWDGIAVGATPIVNLSSGQYQLNITDALGCPFSLLVTIDGPTEVLDHSVNATDESLGADGTANLIVSSGNGSPFTYSIGGTFQSSSIFSNLTAGQYTSYVMDSYGCIDTNTFTVNSQVFVDEYSLDFVTLYPNPTYGIVNVSTPSGSNLTYTVQNSVGQMIMQSELKGNEIDLSNQLGGIYFISFENNEDRRSVKKIIVQ
ncbi:MAG: T9SS type A sorting domain-containing protein [Crocinitomicaceae bacterium]|nr:T9SS type A sorting domain-containing protein [Crocinitomicaceae bacterium]